MKNISILGCGWLGLHLAKALLEKGFFVKGSTTSEAKIPVFENSGIAGFLIALMPQRVQGNLTAFLADTELLIIAIPPQLRGTQSESFVEKIARLRPFIEASSVKKVLFVSSTSVYGEDNTMVTEETIPKPDSEAGKQLLIAEALLQESRRFKTTVVRFGGLIGEDRHPIKFLAGRENIENPDAPINLIHQRDCIGIIQKIIEKEAWNETFNAVAPFHPSRKSYYTQKAIEHQLPLPKFSSENTIIGKTILSDKITKKLGYSFQENKL
jgi:nucleoside-diphosphate-sugar epimerase